MLQGSRALYPSAGPWSSYVCVTKLYALRLANLKENFTRPGNFHLTRPRML